MLGRRKVGVGSGICENLFDGATTTPEEATTTDNQCNKYDPYLSKTSDHADPKDFRVGKIRGFLLAAESYFYDPPNPAFPLKPAHPLDPSCAPKTSHSKDISSQTLVESQTWQTECHVYQVDDSSRATQGRPIIEGSSPRHDHGAPVPEGLEGQESPLRLVRLHGAGWRWVRVFAKN